MGLVIAVVALPCGRAVCHHQPMLVCTSPDVTIEAYRILWALYIFLTHWSSIQPTGRAGVSNSSPLRDYDAGSCGKEKPNLFMGSTGVVSLIPALHRIHGYACGSPFILARWKLPGVQGAWLVQGKRVEEA